MTLDNYYKQINRLNQEIEDRAMKVGSIKDLFVNELHIHEGDGALLNGEYLGTVYEVDFEYDNSPKVTIALPPNDAGERTRFRTFYDEDIYNLEKTEPKNEPRFCDRTITWRKYPDQKPLWSQYCLIIIKDMNNGVRQEVCPFNAETGKFHFYTDQTRILYWALLPELPFAIQKIYPNA